MMQSSDEASNTEIANADGDTAKLAVVTPFSSFANCGNEKKSEKCTKKRSRQKNRKSASKLKSNNGSDFGKVSKQNSSQKKNLEKTKQCIETHRVKSKQMNKQKSTQNISSHSSCDGNQISMPHHISCLENKGSKQTGRAQNFLETLKQTFPSDVVLCALCGLPGNLFPQIGDLYGPYRPTYHDVMDRYDAAAKLFDGCGGNLNRKKKDYKNSGCEVCFDNNTCYITARHPSSNHPTHMSDVATVQNATQSIQNLSPRLHMLQTVDNILLESDKKRHSSTCVKKFHIPGVTRDIRFKSQADNVSNKPHVPKINTMVFVEPTVDIEHNNYSTQCSDSSSIQIRHQFDTSQIWVHSMCAVWTPGVYAIGDQLFGLFQSVRESARRTCYICNRPGASISCYGYRDRTFHHPCALLAKLKMNSDSLMIYL
uniref:Transcription factor 20-like n=1 Tax=Phallusia mammillata TaxID=59560 RepID=A0A6F9DUQ8_9ASCI|nr:transcription factor 20-like [Phallusia mammillata]